MIELEHELMRIKTIEIMHSTDCYYLSEVITEQINYNCESIEKIWIRFCMG